MIVLLLAAMLLTWLPQPVKASDGDVDYSAPYITVDPKTGQLVTRNPGPRLKTHSMDMSGQSMAETPPAVTSSKTANSVPEAVTSAEPAYESDPGISTSTIAIIVAGVFVFGTLAAKKMRQKQ